VDGEGAVSPKRLARLQRIVAEDREAWTRARELAGPWRAELGLALLQRAADTPAPLPVSRRFPVSRRRLRRAHGRRALLVALSGIDGAGKSSQARWLGEALSALGLEVEVVWNDLLGNRALKVLAAPPKAVLRLAGRRIEGTARYNAEAAPRADMTESTVRAVWSVIVTLANALEQRILAARGHLRGRVVVFDRSPLDLAVRMEVLYRTTVGLQRLIVELTAPEPDLAFLLDIPAEVSLARKHDIWAASQLKEQELLYRTLAARFRVFRLDGQRPPDELAAEIASRVWCAVR
jgi:dTMP kinase